jgi:hypothetical protein
MTMNQTAVVRHKRRALSASSNAAPRKPTGTNIKKLAPKSVRESPENAEAIPTFTMNRISSEGLAVKSYGTRLP